MQNIINVDSPELVDESLDYLYKLGEVGFDTETTGLDPHKDKILLIQIGNQYRQYVYDVYKLGEDQIMKVIHYLRRPSVLKIGHFLQFDYSMVKTHYGFDLPNLACTQVGSSLLTKGIINADNSLKGCLDKYLGIKKDKTVRKSFAGMSFGDDISLEQVIYSAEDVEHLIPLYEKIQGFLDERLKDARGDSTLSQLEYETVRVAGDLNVNGIYLDKNMWLELKDKARGEVDAAEEELDSHFKKYCSLDIFGKTTINYNSPAQLLPVLKKITGELIEDTSERTLSRIDHPAVKALLNYRGAIKKVTTYGEEFVRKHINPVTGRVHSNFRQLGTDSGRMASRNPNLQNIPSAQEYRSCFRAQDEENYRMISADFSGQELALLAYISKEDKFLYALNNDMDLHCYSASLIFDIDYKKFFYFDEKGKQEAVKDDPKLDIKKLNTLEDGTVIDDQGELVIRPKMKKEYRTPAKSITFGLIYGMGAGKLADSLEISINKAKSLMRKYFITFPKIKALLDELVKDAMKNKCAYSPLDGRKRLFSGIDWDHGGKVAHMKNIAKNQPFQGAGASVTKLALCRMKKEIDSYGWDARLVLTVHDEIEIEVHKDIAETVARKLEEVMVASFNYYAPGVPMKANGVIDVCWVH